MNMTKTISKIKVYIIVQLCIVILSFVQLASTPNLIMQIIFSVYICLLIKKQFIIKDHRLTFNLTINKFCSTVKRKLGIIWIIVFLLDDNLLSTLNLNTYMILFLLWLISLKGYIECEIFDELQGNNNAPN